MIDSGHFLRGLGLRASLRRTVQEPLRTAAQRMLTGPLRMRRHGRC